MSEFDDRVSEQRNRLAAETWAKGVTAVHAHSLKSMWYDNRPGDTDGGDSVVDTMFNDGSIQRVLQDGSVIQMGETLTGEELLDEYGRCN